MAALWADGSMSSGDALAAFPADELRRLLRGTKPADLPVVQSTKLDRLYACIVLLHLLAAGYGTLRQFIATHQIWSLSEP